MKIERSLQINIALLSITSAMLFGMGERDLRLALLVMVAAVTSIWITDTVRWFALNRLTAGILALITFLLVARWMFPWDNVVAIRSIAQLLVFLQIILLFQRKDKRVYWQLLLLSLLLLVVATVFNQGVFFGLLMVLYLFMAISAMALLFLYHEAESYTKTESALTDLSWQADTSRVWPLGAARSVFVGEVATTSEDQNHSGRDFLGRLMRMGIGTLAFTSVAFFILPRFGQPAWRGPIRAQQRMVGYSGKVELGELGSVIQDPSEVLRINFIDPRAKKPYSVDGTIYLHGTVLTRYDQRRWTSPRTGGAPRDIMVTRLPRDEEFVRQRITIEPMDRPEVFCVQPFFATTIHPELRFDPFSQALTRDKRLCDERFRFGLWTTAFREGRQKSLVPAVQKPRNLEPLLEVPRDQLPTLVERAAQWMAETSLPERRRSDRARYLESKLRNSREFQYSMEAQRKDFNIDPIEDFLKNNPQGHCEYFATTLTLMLRSQGIPARMVVGFKCDEYNPLGKFYQVRQLHAHTWVEAYLPPEDISEYDSRQAGSNNAWANGGWLRLDPTPGTDLDEAGTAGKLLATAGKGADWLGYLWDNYVMEMDRSRQRQAIYQPLVDWVQGTAGRLTSAEWWKETGRQLVELIDPRNWNLSEWFSWRGGLVGMGICFVAVGVYRIARRIVRRSRGWLQHRRRRKAARDARTRVEFYQRFQTLLQQCGIYRQDGQTQREFARDVAGHFAETWIDTELPDLPGQIAEAFYRVRFGGHPLDKTDQITVELAVSKLEEALTRHRLARRRRKETIAL